MIQEHQTLELYNILSYHGRMTQQELNIKAQEIDSLVLQSGAKKNAPVMTTTFSITPLDGRQYMDVEILIPLDREIPTNGSRIFF